MRTLNKAKRVITIMLALALVFTLTPAIPGAVENAYAVNATSVTITASDGTQTVVTGTTGNAGDPWSYDADSVTLTLNNFTGQGIAANGDLNLHLVGTNTINMAASSAEVIGIQIGSKSSMSNLKITAASGGTLNVNGNTQGNFYGIYAYTEITNGTVNIDITSSGSNAGYGTWGNVNFTENETNPAKLNVKVTDTGTESGSIYAIYNGSLLVTNRGNVTINAEAHARGENKNNAVAISELYVSESSPVITATADCKEGASTSCVAVDRLRALGLTGGKLEASGMVQSFYLPDYLDAHVVTTTPADNKYIFLRGNDLGKNNYYHYLCDIDGNILENAEFVYSESETEFKWVGDTHFDIPAGQVGFNKYSSYGHCLLAGLRGADGLYDSRSNTKFEITGGSLPSGLTMSLGGTIYGTVNAPCSEGSITVKATDTINQSRTATFTINYGAFVEPDKYLTVGIGTGSEKKVEMRTDDSDSGWSYDGTTKTLTLTDYNSGPIAAEGDLNLHLVGTNTITIPSSTDTVTGIQIGSGSSMSNLKITAASGGTLNVNGNTQGNFYGIYAYTEITNGTVNIDITSSGSNAGYGTWGNVNFTENETNPAKLNVKVTDTGTESGSIYAIYNGSLLVTNRGNVTINAEAHASGENKNNAVAISELYVSESSPVITATADCKEGASTSCVAVDSLRALGLTGGKLEASGMVTSFYLPDYLDAHVVTTTPADNKYIFLRGNDLGKNNYYHYLCDIDGNILENAEFVYSESETEFKWVGDTHFDIPAGQVGFNKYSSYGHCLLAGLRGADGLYDLDSKTKFEITDGSLPSGLKMNKGGTIYGTVNAPCSEGSITVKATDTNNSLRTETFTINYGAFTSQRPVTEMTLDKTELILEKYATKTITATVTPEDASYPNVKAVSSDTSIASVSVGAPSGVSSSIEVRGNDVGKAVITVTSLDSNLNKTCDVYVKETKPNAGIDYINKKLTGLVNGATYKVTGEGITETTFAASETSHEIDSSWLGKPISLVRTNTEAKCNSDAQIIYIAAKPTATQANCKATSDAVTVENVITVQEYAITAKGTAVTDSDWKSISTSEYTFNGLAPNKEFTVHTRVKATAGNVASDVVTTEVKTDKLTQTITGSDTQKVAVSKSLTLGSQYLTNVEENTLSYALKTGSSYPTGTTMTSVGVITAGATSGTFTITITAPEKGDYKAASKDVEITVTAKKLQYFKSGFAGTETKIYGADPFNHRASLSEGNGGITYTSSNESVATVDDTGVVTILKVGTTTITATAAATEEYETETAEYTLTVNKANPVVPTNLKGTKGKALSTVTLPSGWAWADSSITMNTTGNQTFKANYTPADPENYNAANNVNITVNVTESGGSGGSGGGGGGGGGAAPTTPAQKPEIKPVTGGKVNLSTDGTTATITPDAGKVVDKVLVNGKDMGAVTELKGLKTGDKIEVLFKDEVKEPGKAETDKQVKAHMQKLAPKARSLKTKAGNVKVSFEGQFKDIEALGYTVKYKFYRSTKKASGYKYRLTTSKPSYTNTGGKKGTLYYYKAIALAYDKDGKLIAKTELKQCRYACRRWSK